MERISNDLDGRILTNVYVPSVESNTELNLNKFSKGVGAGYLNVSFDKRVLYCK